MPASFAHNVLSVDDVFSLDPTVQENTRMYRSHNLEKKPRKNKTGIRGGEHNEQDAKAHSQTSQESQSRALAPVAKPERYKEKVLPQNKPTTSSSKSPEPKSGRNQDKRVDSTIQRARSLSLQKRSHSRANAHVRTHSLGAADHTMRNHAQDRGTQWSFSNSSHRKNAGYGNDGSPPDRPHSRSWHGDEDDQPDDKSEIVNDVQFYQELESKWILNLSMHFRDNAEKEKFFVTYAQRPNKWRRVTVLCDYTGAKPHTLEDDLRTLKFQRDKSVRIYEAIRDSVPDIQFLDTVTNLQLQTKDNRLHVHVTEDVNSIIDYPPIAAINHLQADEYAESYISFESHLSGFVYRVRVGDDIYIKKEIPSPDSVDEFLYEVNALFALRHSPHVIRFVGVVVDDEATQIKGLLIDFADGGALVDLLYNARELPIPWRRRERWARQIVAGLADIHEQGFVQGDFTLSNIVINSSPAVADPDHATIIDINRRGCPVGWEPPELTGLIESGQPISLYIGVKTDLWQLGMVLWAVATCNDEPEREDELLPAHDLPPVGAPPYYVRAVEACLSPNPAGRISAKELLTLFPTHPARRDGQTKRLSSLRGDGDAAAAASFASPRSAPMSAGDASSVQPQDDDAAERHDSPTPPGTVTPSPPRSAAAFAGGKPSGPRSRFDHPPHQDSGFDEEILARRGSDLLGIGAHATDDEEDDADEAYGE